MILPVEVARRGNALVEEEMRALAEASGTRHPFDYYFLQSFRNLLAEVYAAGYADAEKVAAADAAWRGIWQLGFDKLTEGKEKECES